MPFFILVSILIKLNSKGSLIYKQSRVGLNNADFFVFKFRTMKMNSDKLGLLTVGGRDPRITSIGFYLRKYKLDELPQLFNVLIGDMSFVGPRPDIAGYYDTLEGEDRKILELKPGLTSLASIKYANEDELLAQQENPLLYNDTVLFPDKVKMNLAYYYNHSIVGDVKLIWKTVFR